MMASRGVARSITSMLAILLPGATAWAVVPPKDASVDLLGISIAPAPDIYTLPAGSIIYHGTYNDWSFASKPRDRPTWFGADWETSAAMSYFRWCGDLNPVMTSQSKGKLSNTNGNIDVLNVDLTPKIMTVKTKKDLNLLFIPFGKDGHKVGMAKIDYIQHLSLYGVGSEKGLAAFNASGLCSKSIGVAGQKILKVDQWKTAQHKLTLAGWRAPWDQNEIALCASAATSDTLEKTSVETLSLDPGNPLAGVPPALSEAYGRIATSMGIKDSKNRGKSFKELLLAAYADKGNAVVFDQFFAEMTKTQKAVCSPDSILKTMSVFGDKGPGGSNSFDIVFKRSSQVPPGADDGVADVPAEVKEND